MGEFLNMKKVISVLLCAILIASVSGCAGSKETPESSEKSAESTSSVSSKQDKSDKSSKPESKEVSQARDYTKEQAEGEITDDGLLIVKQDGHWRAMEQFGGGSGDSYVDSLNNLRSKIDSKVKIYSMPAPLACEFYTPSNLSDNYVSEAECFADISGRLNSGITAVDLCAVMKQHTEEDIYCRTDHHWKPLGAYYAAKTFAEAAGVPFDDISKYNKVSNEGYVGTLYAFYGDERIKNDPEEFTYYEPKTDYSTYYYDQNFDYQYEGPLMYDVDVANSYIRFLGGDDCSVKVKTGVKNGRKLLVVKDSYGNAEIPFFTSSFEEIYVIDMRYFKCNLVNFIDDMGITDVLFTMAAYSAVGVNADNIDTLITQDADSRVVDGQLTADVSEEQEA